MIARWDRRGEKAAVSHRGTKYWAESGEISRVKQQQTVWQAGIKSPSEVRPHMRALIDFRRDTQDVTVT